MALDPLLPHTAGEDGQPSLRHFLVRGLGALAVVAALVAGVLASGSDSTSATGERATVSEWFRSIEGVLTVSHQHVTYEVGEESIYHQAPNEDRLVPTDSRAREGSQAGAVLLLPDDPQYRNRLGYRAEWQSDFRAKAGREYAYGASYYLPEDWDQGSNPRTFDDRIIFQFHEGNGKSPTFSLHIDEDRGQLFVRHRLPNGKFDRIWSTELETGRWYDIAFSVRWSKSDDGFFQVYLDGRLEQHLSGRTLNDSNSIYTKWGIYGQPTRLFVDEVRIFEGIDAIFDATPAEVATLLDPLPEDGIGLVRFSGGTDEDLVDSSGCPDTAQFWHTLDGQLVWFVPSAPDFVNARWSALFGDGLPRNTLLIGKCGG